MLKTLVKACWVLFIGWWLGLVWFAAALLMCWNPIGWIMAYQVPEIVSGEIVGL